MGTKTEDVPKPMIPLVDRPILEYQIELLKKYNINQVTMLTGYKAEKIEEYFGDGSRYGLQISYVKENQPLGTAGAVKQLEQQINEDFLVLYGDIILDIDIDSFISFHKANKGAATITAHPNDHPFDSDLIETDTNNRVTAFHSKPHKKNTYYRNLVNAGVYILSSTIFEYIPEGSCCDFGKDIFPALLKAGEPIFAYRIAEYIKDIGTIERLKEVEGDFQNGKVATLNRKNKRRAIFLDRDGVINYEVDMLQSAEELELLPGTAEAISEINKSEYLAIAVTNQPQIAKGFINEEQLEHIHARLEGELGLNRAYLDRIYYCPHHPEKGFEGERVELKIECECRKPKTGMIEKAVKEFNIDTEHSFLIGDRTVDIMAGINAGLTTILVRTGFAGKDGKYQCEADFVFENLFEAVDFILNKQESLTETATVAVTNNGESN